MAYAQLAGPRRRQQLGDSPTEYLTAIQQAAGDVQTGFQQLASKLTSAGNAAVKISNQTTGAAAGAKVGAQAGGFLPPSVSSALASVPKPVLYGGLALLLYRAFR